MTTYTQLARLPQIVPFDPAVRNAWGPPINAAWNAIEQLAAGNGPIDLSGLTSYSVTVANDATDQARQAMLAFVGTPSGTCTVTVPPISRIGWVSNATSNIIILTAGGIGLTIPIGMSLLYTVTGNVITAVPVGHPNGLVVGGTLQALAAVATSLVVRTAISIGTGSQQFVFSQFNPTTGYTQIFGAGGRDTGGLGLQICRSDGTVQATYPAGTGPVVFNETVNAAAFVTTSDGRAKSQIADIATEDAYAWVRGGRPRTYHIGGRLRAGFVAQEDMANGRGAAVYTMADGRDLYASGDGFAAPGHRLARDYEHDIAYLTKALAAALDRIDALEAASGV